MKILIICLLMVMLLNHNGYSQGEADTLTIKSDSLRPHSPAKAAIFSALLPGLGQAYNLKYWKIPLIYASFATSIYFIDFNSGYYNTYRDALILRLDDDSSTVDNFPLLTEGNIRLNRDYYRRNLEISVIATGIIYALNILDATVDAHLFYFDISDDLSMQVHSSVIGIQNQQYPGLSLTFRLNPWHH